MKRQKINIIVFEVMTILVATCLQVGVSPASTWRVERDGSGDFTTIQPAVDASAPGDTILIGPGNYTEATTVQPSGWVMPTDAFVSVTVGDLTFIGSSPEEVIIGPDSWYHFNNGPNGFLFSDAQGWLRVENVTIHNLFDAIWSLSNRVEANNCHFLNLSNIGIFTASTAGLLVEQCYFEDMDFAVAAFAPCPGIVIRDSEFVASEISLQNNDGVVIDGCNFQGGVGGVQFDSSNGVVNNCEFYGQRSSCLAIIGGSVVSITNSSLRAISGFNNGRGLIANSSSTVTLETCVVDGDAASMEIGSSALVTAHGCTFERSSNWYIWSDYWHGPITVFDFSNNYWGTTDLEEIAAGIIDHNDISTLGFVINFEPIADGPLATENMTLDGVKALYR